MTIVLVPSEREAMLSKVESWMTKAGHENDAFDKYVSYFIGFNILYNMYAKELDSDVDLSDGDKKRAEEVRTLYDLTSSFMNAEIAKQPRAPHELWGETRS